MTVKMIPVFKHGGTFDSADNIVGKGTVDTSSPDKVVIQIDITDPDSVKFFNQNVRALMLGGFATLKKETNND